MANLGPVEKQKTFDQMVDDVAGELLILMIKGTEWRSIIYSACNHGAAWRADRDQLLAKTYPPTGPGLKGLTTGDIDRIVELLKNALIKEVPL